MTDRWSTWFITDAWRPSRRRFFAAIAAAALGLALVAPPPQAHANDWHDWRDSEKHWVGTWAASPQSVDPFTPAAPATFNGQTIRQIVHTSIGGGRLRVRFTNELGAEALTIGAAHIALQSTGSGIVAGSDRELTFAGQDGVSIPKGAPMLSDPVDLRIPPLSNVAITIYLPNATNNTTFHALGRQTTYISGPGNFAGVSAFPTATTTQSWYFLSALEVFTEPRSVAVVTLGDSITDGFASTVDANRRWPKLPCRTPAGVAPLRARRRDGPRHQRQPRPARHHRAQRVVARGSRRPRGVGCQVRDAARRHQ
jgi:hypothetical protein